MPRAEVDRRVRPPCEPRLDPLCLRRKPTPDRIKKWALQPHHRPSGAAAGHCPRLGQTRSCRVSSRRPPGCLTAAFEQRCGAVVVHEGPRECPGGFRAMRESHARPCAGAWLFVFGRTGRGPAERNPGPVPRNALSRNVLSQEGSRQGPRPGRPPQSTARRPGRRPAGGPRGRSRPHRCRRACRTERSRRHRDERPSGFGRASPSRG